MKKLSFLILLVVHVMNAQSVPLSVPPPPAPVISVTPFGGTPAATYYYMVIANYQSGQSQSQIVPARNNVLSASVYNQISWHGLPGVISFDVLQVPTASFTGTSCTCALTTGLSASTLSYRDTGGSLSSYTFGTPAPAASAIIQIDNSDYAYPAIQAVIGNVPSVNQASYPIGSGYVLYAGGDFYKNCQAADAAGMSLAVSVQVKVATTNSCAAQLQFFNGGSLQPASGQTATLSKCLTAPLQQVFDLSQGGTVAISQPCNVQTAWWGNTAAGINAAMAAVATGTGLSATRTAVYLPATNGNPISLGASSITSITIPSGVNLMCQVPGTCAFTANGTGTAFAIPLNTFHAGVYGVYVKFSSAASGETCISITGNGGLAEWSQDDRIFDNTCDFGGAVVSGTTGISAVGTSSSSDVALNWFVRNVILNAAVPITINHVEQNWWIANRIDGYTAPAINIGSDSAFQRIFYQRIAGNGSTGNAMNVGGTRHDIEAWFDSGAANGFNETGNTNCLKGWTPSGGLATGTLAANGGVCHFWNGQAIQQTYQYQCYIGGSLGDTNPGGGTGFSGFCFIPNSAAITVKDITATARLGTATGCSLTPQIQAGNGTEFSSVSFTNGQSNADSGPLTGNFNASTDSSNWFRIGTVNGTGCTGNFQDIWVTVQYIYQ